MIKSIIITDIAIWVSGAGHIARLKALIKFLIKYTYVTVVFLGKKPDAPIDHLLPPKVTLIFLDNENQNDKERNLLLIRKLFEFEPYKICFIEYIHHSFYLQCVPDNVVTVLDAHDIISERNKSFNSFQYDCWDYPLQREREYKIYKLYDYVMFISKKDFEISLNDLDPSRMIIAPHPAVTFEHELKEIPKSIGFVASDYLPNVDSINWFLKNVWINIPAELNVTLNIYGAVCRKIPNSLVTQNVCLKGYQNNLLQIYSEIDIAINPVRIGSGLKIKNMEALANGIPLLTTIHGASGLEEGIDYAFMVADNETQYAEKLINLIQNYQLRLTLSKNASNWIKAEFSEEKCFAKLKELITPINVNNTPMYSY